MNRKNRIPISLTSKNEDGLLAGVLFGLTDFSYRLFVNDLGMDREFTGRGIGRQLMSAALEMAGGEKNIAVYLVKMKSDPIIRETQNGKKPRM